MARWRASSSMTRPEVYPHHVRIAQHLPRLAGRDDLTLVEHHHAVRQIEHRPHDVLHEQDGRAPRADLADEPHRAGDLAGIEPGQDLVEQDEVRPRGEGPAT